MHKLTIKGKVVVTHLERKRELLELFCPLVEHEAALVLLDEVHLVDEAEHLGVLGERQQRLQAGLVVVDVLLQLAALHVKHVDEDLK